jgi:outer membrane receptor protein involved in Fe transport
MAQASTAAALEESDNALSEIVVTAQRRSERLQEVPVSASVVSGGALEQMNITSLQDLSARLPDVKIAEGTVDSLFIRGVGSGANFGFEQAVGTFVDGVYRGRARAIHSSLFDIDQVEVLKGPQTTYFGNNTIAGALNITTRKPGQDFEYNGSVFYDWTLGGYGVEAGVTTPLTDTLSVRVAAKAFGQDGFVSNDVLNRHEPHERNWIGRVSVAWQPNDAWRTDIRVDHNQNRRRGDGAELLGCPPDPAYGGPGPECAQQLTAIGGIAERQLDNRSYNSTPSFENYDMTEVAATNRISFAEYTLSSITSFFKHQDQLFPSTAPFAFPGVGNVPVAVAAAFNENYHEFAQEIRFDSPANQTISYMFGGYFSTSKLDNPEYFGFYFAPFGLFAGPRLTLNTPVASYVSFDQQEKNFSGFGTGTWHITDALRLNAGLRYSVVDKTAHSLTTFGSGGVPPSAANYIAGPASVNTNLAPFFSADLTDFPDPSRRDSKLMPSGSLQYDFTTDMMGYVSYTNGFKAGGFGATFSRNTFAPETVNSYETGLKAAFFEHKLVADLAVFLAKYKNLQENTNIIVPGGIPQSVIRNAARAESKGVELSTNWRPLPMLVLNSDVAYLNSHYTDYPNAPCTVLQSVQTPFGCVQNLSGSVREYSPKFSGNLGGTLTVALPRELEVRINPSVYFTTGFYEAATVDPLLRQSGFGKIDLRIGLGPASQRWEVAFVGQNLTDKLTAMYRNTAIDNGTYYALPDPPRSYGLQVSVKN